MRKGKFDKNNEDCTCAHVGPLGEELNSCSRCVMMFAPDSISAVWKKAVMDDLYMDCHKCLKPYLRFQGGCVHASECPETHAHYTAERAGPQCTTPFECHMNHKVGGDDEGGDCRCTDGTLCRKCGWRAGGAFECLECKKFTHLLNGSCVKAEECVLQGGVPLAGDGPRGGICMTTD